MNGRVGLLRTLGESAVSLRRAIEPGDDKPCVQSLIFLRFLSLHHERRYADLTRLIADPEPEIRVNLRGLQHGP